MTAPVEQYVSRPEELAACCAILEGSSHLGLDTEFVGEDTYRPELCLIQVAAEDRLVLIDPQTVGPLDCFWKLVTNPARVTVVHAGREEARLCWLFTGCPPGNLFDVQIAAGLVGLPYPMGHGALVSRLLGVSLAKSETLTEWRTRPLTSSQIEYAYNDVRYLLPLWRRLQAELAQLGRLDWAREEFDRLARTASPESSATDERWRRIRGAGGLDRRRLAIVRELYLWREAEAARSNRPARVICRDDLLVEVARRQPRRPRDLHVIRGLSHRYADPIWQVAQRARQLPIDQCPQVHEREQDPVQVGLIAGLLSAVLGDLCARRRLAVGLVANNEDLRSLVRARLETGAAPARELGAGLLLGEGWRRDHILPRLAAVLDGRCRVRVADVRADAPLQLDEQ